MLQICVLHCCNTIYLIIIKFNNKRKTKKKKTRRRQRRKGGGLEREQVERGEGEEVFYRNINITLMHLLKGKPYTELSIIEWVQENI